MQVACITIGISLFSWLLVFMAMMMMMPFIPFVQHRTHQQQQAVASLAGTLAIARSPASAVSLLHRKQQQLCMRSTPARTSTNVVLTQYLFNALVLTCLVIYTVICTASSGVLLLKFCASVKRFTLWHTCMQALFSCHALHVCPHLQ